jgi:glycosyltransferase involved in cell wall biosynthesis
MKIASFSTNGYPSEKRKYLSLFTHEQALALIEKGVDVEVIDLAPDKEEFPKNTQTTYEGVTVHRVLPISLSSPSQSLKTISYLKKCVRKSTFDILLCSFLDSQYIKYLPWIFNKAKMKLCFTVHGRDAMIPYVGVKGTIKAKIKRYLFQISNFCFPVSEYTETLLSCLINRDEDKSRKIKVIYNGINEKKFESVMDKTKKELREKLNLPPEAFIVISVCQLIKRKGVQLVVEGVLKSMAKNENIFHIIVGEGPEKESILNLVKQSSYENRFLFLSNLSSTDLVEYSMSSDLYSMLSMTFWKERATEGFGISYIEASYLGQPVICGKDGGGTIAVQNNFTGYWVDPRDIKCSDIVSEKILFLINHPEEYKRLSENGKLYARREFSWALNAQRITEVINL